MLFFAKNKLASLDKKITVYLAKSKWYGNNCSRTFDHGLDPIDQNEEWVSLVIEFIWVVWNEKGYRNIVEPAGLDRNDLFKIYLLMTMATMPSPIIKTGRHPMAHSLIASCIYQQEKRQLIPFMNQLRISCSGQNVKYGEEYYVETAIKFADLLDADITAAFGPILLGEAANRLTGGREIF
jgi:hypothetical protein